MLKRIFFSYRNLPGKKQYIEFFTALLSVPVLLTVILLNINNLSGNNAKKEEPAKGERIIIAVPSVVTPSKNQTIENETQDESPSDECKKEIGPIEIISPKEGVIVDYNPVSVDVSYEGSGDYCAVVWSYRINNDKWSEYGDNSISLYNLTRGDVLLEMRVKSIVTGEEKILKRSFEYIGDSTIVTPTITLDDNSSTDSAN